MGLLTHLTFIFSEGTRSPPAKSWGEEPFFKYVIQKEVSIGVKGFDTALWMSPIKMFEYMSVGVPIISSDLPVLREILIDKHNCLLVDPEDLMCWSSALKKILYNKLFSDKISGIAYREFRQKYTWEFRAKNILSTLEY